MAKYLTDMLYDATSEDEENVNADAWSTVANHGVLRLADDGMRQSVTTVDLRLNAWNAWQWGDRRPPPPLIRRGARDASLDEHWKMLGWKRMGNMWRKVKLYRSEFNGAVLTRSAMDMSRSLVTQKWVYKVGFDEVVNNVEEWQLHGWFWMRPRNEWWKMAVVPMKTDGGARMVQYSVGEGWVTEQWEAYE